jgi:hypothetical protein
MKTDTDGDKSGTLQETRPRRNRVHTQQKHEERAWVLRLDDKKEDHGEPGARFISRFRKYRGKKLALDYEWYFEPTPACFRRLRITGLQVRALLCHTHRTCSGSTAFPLSTNFLLSEVDMLDEHDLTVIVLHDVVAVKPIALLIEFVGALDARVVLEAQDRLADLLRLKTLSVVDRER